MNGYNDSICFVEYDMFACAKCEVMTDYLLHDGETTSNNVRRDGPWMICCAPIFVLCIFVDEAFHRLSDQYARI
jgi:hypothetical protein